MNYSRQGQAMASKAIKINANAFDQQDKTSIYWLGNASILINSHGTDILIDPLLKGFDMPLLMEEMPIDTKDVPQTDAVLITHIDNDHFSRPTLMDIKDQVQTFVAPNYVADVMNEEGYATQKKTIGDEFEIEDVKVRLTPALHNWQNGSSKWNYRDWKPEDYCGYYMNTVDGSIYLPGDSKLLEEQLHMPSPDVILFDFADNDWHITLDGAIQLANTYPDADLICIHWGCVDAPNMTPFNGNPEVLKDRIVNPERIRVLAPGEEYVLKGRKA